jgi:alpha-1,6-mannosyltransferase
MTSLAAQDIQENQAQEPAPQDVETPPSGRPGPATTPLRADVKEPWLALAAIVVLGGLSGAAYYLGFVRPYLLEQYFATPLLDLAKINGHTAQSANAWGLTWLITFACYYLAFRLCPPSASVTSLFRRVALFLICGWAAFFAINLIFMYPVGAADLFDQIFRARLTVHYGFNPFTTLPNSIQGDPFQTYVAWRGDPSPYGPMWEALAAGASWLGGDSLWRNLIVFKVLVSVAYGIGVALTYGILREIRPDWALRGTLFFAWNPLVLFEVAGNGHNDAIVIMFMLAGIYFLVKGWRSAVLPALAAGALTKFIPVLLVPVAAAAIWRDRLRKRNKRDAEDGEEEGPLSSYEALTNLAIGAILSLGLALVLYAPFWTGPESVLPRNRSTLFTASIPKVVLDTLVNEFGMRDATAQALVRNVAYGIVALVALGCAVYIFRMRNAVTVQSRAVLIDRTLRAFYEIIFVYLMVAALWFQPWYLMWLVALTAPVARYTYANRTLLFCLGGIANYFVWDYIWLWNRTDIRTNQVTAALAIYALPLLYTLYVWLRPIWDRRDAAERGAELAPAHTGG